jgi:hypothetical protein
MPDGDGYADPDLNIKLPWKRFKRHYIPIPTKKSKGFYLTCAGEQCLVCAYGKPRRFGFDDVQPDDLLKKCYAQTAYAFSGWIEAWHHVVEFQKDDKSGTYKSREICGNKSCKYCKEDWPKVYGNRFHVALSAAAWNGAMDPIMERIERLCQDCGEFMYVPQYVCGNEECGITHVDLVTCGKCTEAGDESNCSIETSDHTVTCATCESTWSLLENEDSELSALVNDEKAQCPECNYVGNPIGQLVCSTDECEGNPYGLYDAAIWVRRETVSDKTKTVCDKFEVGDPDPRLFDPQYQIDTTINDEGKALEAAQKIADRHKECLDLDAIYAPDPPTIQEQRLNKDNLFAPGGGGGSSRTPHQRYQKRSEAS